MSDDPQTGTVGRIMDKAERADRRALFAALQAALGQITDLRFGGILRRDPYLAVEEALDVGAPYGSPEHLAHLERKAAEVGEISTEEDQS